MRRRPRKVLQVLKTPAEFVQLVLDGSRTLDLRINTNPVKGVCKGDVVILKSLGLAAKVRIVARHDFRSMHLALESKEIDLNRLIPEASRQIVWSKHRDHYDDRIEKRSGGVVVFEIELIEEVPEP